MPARQIIFERSDPLVHFVVTENSGTKKIGLLELSEGITIGSTGGQHLRIADLFIIKNLERCE